MLKEDIAHYKRARAKGPGVDADYSMEFMRISMGIHIHDQSEQLNITERKKLFRKGEAATVPDPGCAALLKPKSKATSKAKPKVAPKALTETNVRASQF